MSEADKDAGLVEKLRAYADSEYLRDLCGTEIHGAITQAAAELTRLRAALDKADEEIETLGHAVNSERQMVALQVIEMQRLDADVKSVMARAEQAEAADAKLKAELLKATNDFAADLERVDTENARLLTAAEGYKLAPVEPTEAMVDAAWEDAIPFARGTETHAMASGWTGFSAEKIYKAMLAAAPPVEAAQEALRVDAERYRWLRDECYLEWRPADNKNRLFPASTINAAIDASKLAAK